MVIELQRHDNAANLGIKEGDYVLSIPVFGRPSIGAWPDRPGLVYDVWAHPEAKGAVTIYKALSGPSDTKRRGYAGINWFVTEASVGVNGGKTLPVGKEESIWDGYRMFYRLDRPTVRTRWDKIHQLMGRPLHYRASIVEPAMNGKGRELKVDVYEQKGSNGERVFALKAKQSDLRRNSPVSSL